MKIVKNTTGSAIEIKDVGMTIPANSSYTLLNTEYALWAESAKSGNTTTLINNGSLVINDGISDLAAFLGLDLIKNEGERVNNSTYSTTSPRLTNTTSTLNGVLTLTNLSNFEHVLNGTALGYKYKLPNATTLTNGWKFEIWNQSDQVVTIIYNDNTTFILLPAQSFGVVTLESNATTNGSWLSFRAYTGTASGVLHYKITSSTPFVTSSSSDTPITGMAVIPTQGTYGIWNNFDLVNTQNNGLIHNSIYYNGSQITDSERSAQSTSANWQGVHTTITTIQCDGLKTIDTRVRISQGQLTVAGRTMLLIRLGD